jgi:hypothetical protein
VHIPALACNSNMSPASLKVQIPVTARVEMEHNRFSRLTQNFFRISFLAESDAHVRANSSLANLRGSQLLGLLSLTDIGYKASKYPVPSLVSSPNDTSTGNSCPFLRKPISSVPCQLICRWPLAR